MKSKKLLIVLLLISIFTFAKVNAKGPFYLDWETDENSNKVSVNSKGHQDNYLIYDTNKENNKVSLTIYDKDGQSLHEKEFANEVTYEEFVFSKHDNIIVKDNNIYLYTYSLAEETGIIRLLDLELNIKKEIKGDYGDIINGEDELYVMEYQKEGNSRVSHIFAYVASSSFCFWALTNILIQYLIALFLISV